MIRKTAFLFSLLIFFCASGFAQYAYRIRPMPALPATCNPLNGEVVMLTAGAGVSPGVYNCTALNTWRTIGMIGNGLVINQGTLTLSTPFLQQTATWNNGAVTFVNETRNITDTASAAASLFADYQIGGVSRFMFTKNARFIIAQPSLVASTPFIDHSATWNNGAVTFINFDSNVTDTASAAPSLLFRLRRNAGVVFTVGPFGDIGTSAGGTYFFTGRSQIRSAADGRISLLNNGTSDFTRLNLGPEAVTHPAIGVSPAVGGQTQGIIILKANGTAAAFGDLGAATNGSIIYCSDCTIASPCAGGGNGALAKRLNGAWVCN